MTIDDLNTNLITYNGIKIDLDSDHKKNKADNEINYLKQFFEVFKEKNINLIDLHKELEKFDINQIRKIAEKKNFFFYPKLKYVGLTFRFQMIIELNESSVKSFESLRNHLTFFPMSSYYSNTKERLIILNSQLPSNSIQSLFYQLENLRILFPKAKIFVYRNSNKNKIRNSLDIIKSVNINNKSNQIVFNKIRN